MEVLSRGHGGRGRREASDGTRESGRGTTEGTESRHPSTHPGNVTSQGPRSRMSVRVSGSVVRPSGNETSMVGTRLHRVGTPGRDRKWKDDDQAGVGEPGR